MKSVPAYEKAASQLRKKILRGEFLPGQRLPTERALCELLGVSRITIRQALDLLDEEHLIYRRQGSGTFVKNHPRAVLPLGIDYAGSVREHAPGLRRKLLSMEWKHAPETPAWASILENGEPLLLATRIDQIEKRNVAWDICAIPRSFASNLTKQDLKTLDFIQRWTELEEIQISALRQQVSAVPASSQDAIHLGISEGAPVLQTIETYENQTGQILGVFFSHYLPAKIELHTKFDWPSSHKNPHS